MKQLALTVKCIINYDISLLRRDFCCKRAWEDWGKGNTRRAVNDGKGEGKKRLLPVAPFLVYPLRSLCGGESPDIIVRLKMLLVTFVSPVLRVT